MSTVLWPRLEVFQLISKNVEIKGKALELPEILKGAQYLKKKKIDQLSYNDWFILTQDFFDWEEKRIAFYWEILCFSVYYYSHDLKVIISRRKVSRDKDEKLVDFESVIIFLCLLIDDPSTNLEQNLYPDLFWTEETNHDKNVPVEQDHTFLGDVHPSVLQNIHGHLSSSISPHATGLGGLMKEEEKDKEKERDKDKERIFSFKEEDLSTSSTSLAPPLAPTTSSPPLSPNKNNNIEELHTPPHTEVFSPIKSPHTYLSCLLLIRRRVPVIFYVLSMASRAAEQEKASLDQLSSPSGHTYKLNKKVVNKLGMILCGGVSREQAIFPLSHVYPLWSSEPSIRSSFLVTKTEHSSLHSVRTFLEWLNSHLVMNDVVYPTSTLPSLGLPSSYTTSSQTLSRPHIISAPISSVSRFSPVYLNDIKKNTLFYKLSSNPSRSLSFRRKSTSHPGGSLAAIAATALSTSSAHGTPISEEGVAPAEDLASMERIDEIATDIQNGGQGLGVPPRRKSMTSDGSIGIFSDSSNGRRERRSVSFDIHNLEDQIAPHSPEEMECEISERESDPEKSLSYEDMTIIQETAMAFNALINCPDASLSPLILQNSVNSTFYLLSPFYSVTVSNCRDCTLLIGPTFGAIHMLNCSNVHLTCFCKKLIVSASQSCVISLATLSTSVVFPDCENITFGPVDVVYKTLRNHLKLADLSELAEDPTSTEDQTPINCWDCVWDLRHKCYMNSTGREWVDEWDQPQDDPDEKPQIHFLKPEDYSVRTVPLKEETLEIKDSPIHIPDPFLNAYKKQTRRLNSILNLFSTDHLQSQFPGQQVDVVGEEVKELTEESDQDPSSSSTLGPRKFYRDRQRQVTIDTPSSSMAESDSEEEDAVRVHFECVLEKFTATSTISQSFMHWLVDNEHINEVLDLISLDMDKSLSISL